MLVISLYYIQLSLHSINFFIVRTIPLSCNYFLNKSISNNFSFIFLSVSLTKNNLS